MRILVVGGGIAGLSAVLALRQRGFAPELVEARAGSPTEGAAITVHGNGVRALRALGVGGALDAAAAVVPRWVCHDRHGEPLCTTDLTALWDAVAPCLGVTRTRLTGLLRDAADVPLRYGCAVTGLRQDDREVHVGFADGSSAAYDLVVGADGIHSAVRKALSGVAPTRTTTVGWRGVVPGRPAGVEHLVLLMGDGCFLGLVPVGGGDTYGFAGTRAGEEPLGPRLARFGGPAPDFLARIGDATPQHVGPMCWVPFDRWHAGRVVLIGDAAHATYPHMGQGGALAVEDALVLADELARADTVPAALDAHVRRRRPRVAWVHEQSRRAADAWMLPPDVRDAALRADGDRLLQERYRPLRAAP